MASSPTPIFAQFRHRREHRVGHLLGARDGAVVPLQEGDQLVALEIAHFVVEIGVRVDREEFLAQLGDAGEVGRANGDATHDGGTFRRRPREGRNRPRRGVPRAGVYAEARGFGDFRCGSNL